MTTSSRFSVARMLPAAFSADTLRNEWLSNIPRDLMAGMVVALALLMIGLVRDHGLEYLFAATVLTGVLQILFGTFKLARFMKFVPRSVMTGFVNALAILIFMAQLPQFIGAGWLMYAFVAAGLAIIYLLPRLCLGQ